MPTEGNRCIFYDICAEEDVTLKVMVYNSAPDASLGSCVDSRSVDVGYVEGRQVCIVDPYYVASASEDGLLGVIHVNSKLDIIFL
jgi:hypothetical protein